MYVLVVKVFLYECKMEDRTPDFADGQSYFKVRYNIVKNLHANVSVRKKHLSNWKPMKKD